MSPARFGDGGDKLNTFIVAPLQVTGEYARKPLDLVVNPSVFNGAIKLAPEELTQIAYKTVLTEAQNGWQYPSSSEKLVSLALAAHLNQRFHPDDSPEKHTLRILETTLPKIGRSMISGYINLSATAIPFLKLKDPDIGDALIRQHYASVPKKDFLCAIARYANTQPLR